MKLVVLMCAEEFAGSARKIFNDAKIQAFSESSINGFKLTEDNESDNWFAGKHAMENSEVIFTVCNDQKAGELMNAISDCKVKTQNDHVYAFQLNVEKFIM